jgi:hypothetical protein
MRIGQGGGLMAFVGLVGLVGLLPGCEGGVAVNYYDADPPRHRTVHVEHGHVCGHTCSHYWSGGEFIILRGHRHGPGCGHSMHEGRWIVVRPAPEVRVHADTPDVHIHRDSPDVHVYTEPADVHVHRRSQPVSRTVTRVEHVHGPGCGHAYIEGRWIVRH